MSGYTHPVSQLLALSPPAMRRDWLEYAMIGIDRACEPDLIRLMQDRELAQGAEPECYAQVHAWRALAQLRSSDAVPAVLELIETVDDDWEDDWASSELPVVLAKIGPVAFPPTVECLRRNREREFATMNLATAVKELGSAHPELRLMAIRTLESVLLPTSEETPGANGVFVSCLVDLKAVESWPVIEAAFRSGNVEEFIAGDADNVKWMLGLGPKPSQPYGRFRSDVGSTARPTSKQRAEERSRKRKLERKKQRRNR